MSISLILIFILIFLISTYNKISFKKFLSISDIMHFEFIYIIILVFNKIKNIIKIAKCYFLKINLIFDIFFDIDLIIKQSKFIKYIVFSIFFYSAISLLLIKVIVKFVITIANALSKSSLKLKIIFLNLSSAESKTILLIFLILFL